jgi:hypothetical protein
LDLQPELPPGGNLLDPFDRRALPLGKSPSRDLDSSQSSKQCPGGGVQKGNSALLEVNHQDLQAEEGQKPVGNLRPAKGTKEDLIKEGSGEEKTVAQAATAVGQQGPTEETNLASFQTQPPPEEILEVDGIRQQTTG